MTERDSITEKPRRGRRPIVTGRLHDVIVSDLDQLAEKHRIALSTVIKMGFLEVRRRSA